MGNKALRFKSISDHEGIGLIIVEDKYFWRYRKVIGGSTRAIHSQDLDFPRKKFHSLKAFERFVKTKLK